MLVVFAVAGAILSLAWPADHTSTLNALFAFTIPLGVLYSLSFLVTLSSRKRIRRKPAGAGAVSLASKPAIFTHPPPTPGPNSKPQSKRKPRLALRLSPSPSPSRAGSPRGRAGPRLASPFLPSLAVHGLGGGRALGRGEDEDDEDEDDPAATKTSFLLTVSKRLARTARSLSPPGFRLHRPCAHSPAPDAGAGVGVGVSVSVVTDVRTEWDEPLPGGERRGSGISEQGARLGLSMLASSTGTATASASVCGGSVAGTRRVSFQGSLPAPEPKVRRESWQI